MFISFIESKNYITVFIPTPNFFSHGAKLIRESTVGIQKILEQQGCSRWKWD